MAQLEYVLQTPPLKIVPREVDVTPSNSGLLKETAAICSEQHLD